MEDIENEFFDNLVNDETEKVEEYFETEEPWLFRDSEGYTALHRATFMDLEEMVVMLVNQTKRKLGLSGKVEFNAWVNQASGEGFTALHYASYVGNLTLIKLLIRSGANTENINKRGQNVLHLACQGDRPSSLVYFKEVENMTISSVDNSGSTPLHWACYSGSEAAFNFLVTWEQNLDAIDNEGLTALHLCIAADRPRFVRKLIQKGASTTIPDKKGRTPLILAKSKNKNTIVSILERNEVGWQNTLTFKNPVKFEKSRANLIIFALVECFLMFSGYSLDLPSVLLSSNRQPVNVDLVHGEVCNSGFSLDSDG